MTNNFVVKLLNYQKVRKAEMEFIPGLNVIVGESNNGKTACLRSLETAIYNIPREDHITLGETVSAVGIKYNGHEVIWRRDKDKASQVTYRIDGKIYGKLGRGQPAEVAEALGITELDINDKKFRLNFSKQMSYPFLLDSTPADMFKFIAQSSGEDNLVEVLKQMKKDTNEISASVKSNEETQKVLGESLVQLEKRFKEIKDNRQYCEEIISLDSKVKSYQNLLEDIETYKKCTNAVEKMTNSLNYFKRVFNDLNSSVSVAESNMKRVNELRWILDGYYTLQRDNIQYELDLSKYNGKLERYEKFINALSQVFEIQEDKQQELAEWRTRISEYSGLHKEVEQWCKKIEDLSNVVDECERGISEIGVCPYCGSMLGGNHGQHTD